MNPYMNAKDQARGVDLGSVPEPNDGMQHASFALAARRLAAEELQTRGVGDTEKDRALYEVAISSEAEIERWFGLEILEHSAEAVDLTRLASGAAVLVDHRGDQVGVVHSPRIDTDRVLRGFLEFSRSQRGQEIERDVADGIRRLVSVGYMVRDVEHSKREVGQDRKGDPEYVDVYRVKRWQPAEVSIVSVPADVTVGVGRSASGYPVPVAGESQAVADAGAKQKGTPMAEQGEVNPAGAGTKGIVLEDHRSESEKARDKDRAEIFRICDANGVGARAPEWIEQGLTVDQVAHEIIKIRRTPRGAGEPAPGGANVNAGLRYSDRKRYSYARAVLLAAGIDERGQDGKVKFDGIEAEMHQELLRRYQTSGLPLRGNGVLVPFDLRTPDEYWQDLERRALDSKTVAKGAETVFEVPGELIELLRNRAAVVALGARTLTGLSGPISFPKQTGPGTASWVGENPATDLTDSDLGLGLVTLQPKTLQSTTAYARQLLIQSSVDVESLVRNDLAAIHALAIDRAAIHGQSAAGQPTGIYLAPDVQAKAISAIPTYALLVSQASLIADKNADEGALGWLTTPLMAATMMTKAEHDTAAVAKWVWQGTFRDGTMVGYPARSSNQVSKTMSGSAETGASEHGIIFANWNDMIIGMFGALEIVVDPYAKKKRGLIEVTSFQMCDLILRHGESFAKSTGAVIV